MKKVKINWKPNTKKHIYLILATVFAAINTAEKYPGLLSLALVFLALVFQVFWDDKTALPKKLQRFLLQSLLVTVIFIVSLFVVAPFLFIEYKSVIQALVTESRSAHLGADSLGWLGNMWFYIKTFYANVKILGILLLALGSVFFIKNFDKKYILVLYGIFYWVALSKLALHWERWALPMYIAPLFLISFGISKLLEFDQKSKVIKWAGILVVCIFLIQQGIHSLYTPIRLKYTDTRVTSLSFCDLNGITQNNSIFEGYTPLQPTFLKTLFESYVNEGAEKEYIVLSSSMYDRFYAEASRYKEEVSIYQEIRTNYKLIGQFNPSPIAKTAFDQVENIIYFIRYRLGTTTEVRYSGPAIEIYQKPN